MLAALVAELVLVSAAVLSTADAFRCTSKCWCELTIDGLVTDCSDRGFAEVPSGSELDPDTLDLRLDDNRLSELPAVLSNAVPRLRSLSASGNTIAFLDPRTFSRLRHLTELRLSRNRLQHLDARHLADCRELRVLDVSYNLLSTLPLDLLASLPVWLAANFSYNLIRTLTPAPMLQQARTGESATLFSPDDQQQQQQQQQQRSLDLSHNLLSSVSAGFRIPDASCPLVLDLSGSPALSYTAGGALKPMLQALRRCSLAELRLRRLGLTRLPGYAFVQVPLTRLQRLILSNNALAAIEPGALSALTSLSELNLSDNRLTELPDFSDLASLTRIDLSHNLLTVLEDPTRLPTSLRHLSLGRNSLRVAQPDLFLRFPGLESLDLRDNDLTNFRPNDRHLAQLRELQLGGNQLRREHLAAIFGASQWLQRLDLSRNRISQIGTNMTAASQQLRYLNLSWNGFPQIEPLDLGARRLEELDMTGNRVQILADYGSPMLLRLHMGANNISTIDAQAFRESSGVQLLDLSDNPMEARTIALFKSSLDRLSGSLRVFKLNGYEIYAYLKNNAWEFFRDFHALEELELTRCNIRQAPGSSVIFPSSLKRLSLDRNPILEINAEAFRAARHLRDVSITHARIASVSAEAMTSLVSLRRLNLLGNPLRCDCERLRHFWHWARDTNVTLVGLHGRSLKCARPAAVRDQPVLDLQLGSCASAFTHLPTVLAGAASLVILLVAAAAYAALCRRRSSSRSIINSGTATSRRGPRSLRQSGSGGAASASSAFRSSARDCGGQKCIIEV